MFVIPLSLSLSLSLSLVGPAIRQSSKSSRIFSTFARLRLRVDKLAGDCDEKRNGSRCQRFSVGNLRGLLCQGGTRPKIPSPGTSVARFRETKKVAGEPAKLEQGNWGVLSSRCDTGARDANGVAETMSTLIGEHHADDSYGEVRCAGFPHTPSLPPARSPARGGKVRESGGRYLSI